MNDIAATFRKPFPEQVAAWRSRLQELRPTFGSADPAYAEQTRAFMVAGAVKADLLADFAAAIDRAVVEGTGYQAFRAEFAEIVERNGWHGWTGEETARGREWRMRTIYATNMRVSYMAGRHAQLVRGNYRFWVYRHSRALEPRLQHLAWDGLALPPDHPFWAQHYPPNGWGCGCEVYGARTEAGIRRVGGDPGKTLPEGWDAIDPRTGLPSGIGAGWGAPRDVGMDNLIETMSRKTVNWPYEVAKAYMTEVPEEVAERFALAYRALPETAEAARRYAQAVQQTDDLAKLVASQPYRSFGMLTPQEASYYGELLGQSLDRFDFTVGAYQIQHVLSGHGSTATETSRGQRPVTPSDFGLIGLLLTQFDQIEVIDGALVFTGIVDGDRVRLVFVPLSKRRMLSLQTMYVFGKTP
jgi:hypothetical protein